MLMLPLLGRLQSLNDGMALAVNGREISYSQLANEIVTAKSELSKSCQPGDVVAILGDYSVEAIAAFFGLAELGCIIVPITTTVESEISDRLEIAGVVVVIRAEGGQLEVSTRNGHGVSYDLYDELRRTVAPGLVLFSSGSTGKPKAMVHDLRGLMASYEGRRQKSLCFMVFLMFDHIGGINSLLNGIATGATLVLVREREPAKVAELVQKYKVNVLPASPTFLNLLAISGVTQQYDFSTVRMITYGTEPMPESLLLRLRDIFPRAKMLQTFGTSETGIASTSSQSSNSTFIKFDDPNVEHQVVDGELWLRSKTQIMGYLNASMESFTNDGWFQTGDLVEEENGFLRIIGRRKEMINVGGEKVLPSEVESCLLEIPEIADCMVYSEKHALTGQCVAAQIVIKAGCNSSDIVMKVRKHCIAKLSRYKVPAKVTVVESTNFGDRFKKLRLNVNGGDA